jgi:SAM-dependent methyltransferase
MTKLHFPAPERNKAAILDVLARVLPATGTVLEVGSGSGQHVVHFATALPGLSFLPSDVELAHLESVRAWVAEVMLPNLRAPILLDVCTSDWGVGVVDAIFTANMIHIAPWECAVALFDGALRHLSPLGVLVLYGPFHIGGLPTAPSNADFDRDLQRRDARWGVRDLEAVAALGAERGFDLSERVPMPANNQILVFRRAM